ncbi:MAG: ribosome maturation factor RimM [Rhodospirillaceae bacterium]
MTARPDPAELVLLGTVGAPRGIKGDIRIKSFTEAPEDIAAYGPLWNADATRSFKVRVIGEAKGQILVRIDGVGDRTAAEALKGTGLYVPRSALPAPDDDSYYLVDLIGLRVETKAGEAWGEVRAVHDFGAGDVLELAGGPHAGLMIPFTRDSVPEVDLTGGRLVVDPPDGLLEPPEGGAGQDKE